MSKVINAFNKLKTPEYKKQETPEYKNRIVNHCSFLESGGTS